MVQITVGIRNTCVFGITAFLLAGCINSSGSYRPPVEDRTDASGGVVQSVDPATNPVDVRPSVVAGSRSETTVAVPVPTPMTTRAKNPAVIALLDSATQQKSQGALQAAGSSLERAQRIAPRDPEVYYQLADLRRVEGQWTRAEQLALKGTNMAIGDVIMQRRLWLLIAEIRQGTGDRSGAQEAYAKAQSY